MPKILIQDPTDHHKIGCEFNRGGAAVVICTMEALKTLIPEAEFVSFIQLTDAFSARNNIRVVKNKLFSATHFSLMESLKSWWLFLRCALWAILHKYFHINASPLVNNRRLKEYSKASVVVDLSMDHYNDESGIIKVIEISRELLLGVLLGKPVVVYAQSVGPFRSKLARCIAMFALNRVSLITVREEISKGFLDEMAVNKPPIQVTADPAFLLEPAPARRITEILSGFGLDNCRLLVGIGTPEGELLGGSKTWRGYKSVLIASYRVIEYCLPERLFLWLTKLIKRSNYFATLQLKHSSKIEVSIAQIADHLVEKMGASVLLVPHYVPPRESVGGRENGLVIAEEIHRLVSHKDKVIPVTGEYSPQEIKGLIGQCALFVSMKMHPTIAATSQCVPTVAIGSHQKYRGIMQGLGQGKWFCDHISDDLIAKIDDAWIHREEIVKELKSKQEIVREKALLNARLVKQLLDAANAQNDRS
jgi:colanic acid/amylovoran biosynthesis protein